MSIDQPVRVEIADRIASIVIDRPPVNAVNAAVRRGLLEALAVTKANPNVDGVVLVGAMNMFCAGSDIEEFDAPPAPPSSVEVFAALDDMPKPIVAAVAGVAYGGGLELALACHYRVAVAGTRLGLPEVKLGIMPGGGGTQRLPRIIGFAQAAAMIFRGDPVGAEKALAIGLLDELYPDNLRERARAFLRARIGHPLPRLHTGNRHVEKVRSEAPEFEALLIGWVKKAREPKAAQTAAAALRAAAELPFAQGLARERQLFLGLRDGAEAKAYRYLFFAERAAAKSIDDRSVPIVVSDAAVVGAGTMGTGIAMALANANKPVVLVDSDATALDRAMSAVASTYRRRVESGAIDEAESARRIALIRPAAALEAVAQVGLVIEAVFEDLSLKKDVFRRLDRIMRSGAILATNTSTLDIDDIAASTIRRGDVVGMHFFSPANVMPLIEVVRGRATKPEVVRTVVALGRAMGKTPVVVGVCDGFVGNRMHLRRAANVERLLQEGVLPIDIDRVATEFGFAMGPCATSDLTGLDVQWRIRQSKGVSFPIADALCLLGRFGQKTGAGYYCYETGSRRAIVDPMVTGLIRKTSAELGHRGRPVSDQEILDRLLLPIINEGARILEDGIARCAGDIDVIWTSGYGWPAYRGGPMYYADRIGLAAIRDRLTQYADQLADETLRPANLIDRLVAAAHTFSSVVARMP